jgi:hypothetical protein
MGDIEVRQSHFKSYIIYKSYFASRNVQIFTSEDLVIMASFDVMTAKNRFPALNQPQVFFDNAGGSQTLGTVIES